MQPLYQHIQFIYPQFDGGQFPAFLIGDLRLLGFPAVLHLLNKFGFIVEDIAAYPLYCLQNRRFQNRCFDEMRGASFPSPGVAEPAALESGIGIEHGSVAIALRLRA